MNFDNLKMEAQISDNYVKRLLIKNICYQLFNTLVMHMKEPENYMILLAGLLKVRRAENIVKLTWRSHPKLQGS